ncbi:MAG: hypothetical protein ACYTFW_22230 [Planctomycetota bacterium]|jgi:hypothetical protein
MAIIFHCDHCGKKIEAADTAGGKWGKCPACHNKLYVPRPDSGEELKLAPLNETDQHTSLHKTYCRNGRFRKEHLKLPGRYMR